MEQNEQDFWDMRSKDGRDQIFADAALLWENARAYFKYCKGNPLKHTSQNEDERFSVRVQAITIYGLCLYIGCTAQWFEDFKSGLADREEEWTDADKAMQEVIDRIEQVVYLHKYNYAIAGLMNVRMVIREIEMGEKKDVEDKRPVWRARVADDDE